MRTVFSKKPESDQKNASKPLKSPSSTEAATSAGMPLFLQRQVIKEEEELLQGKFSPGEAQGQPRNEGGSSENRTGMPGRLKASLETLSGMDLSGVRIHHNSAKPAQVNALAYTQGQNIHIGPGQEKHIPHEGWHAVQQMQGRVKPTIQAKGVSINDDAGLEREADMMGARALQKMPSSRNNDNQKVSASHPAPSDTHSTCPTIQRAMKFEFQTGNYLWRINQRGSGARLLPRKYGGRASRKQPYITRGTEGEEAVRVGDPVKPKKNKLAQYIYTYKVRSKSRSRVKLIKKEKREGHRATLHWNTYESKFVDRKGHPLNVHLAENGKLKDGPGAIRRATKAEEQTAIELQSETGGFIEFETPKWFRKWSALKKRIQEAVDMTKAMSSDITAPLVSDPAVENAVKRRKGSALGELREWPTTVPGGFKIDHLRSKLRGGKLLVEIEDPSWEADIQSSEGIALAQYQSLLEEHEESYWATRTISGADEILTDASLGHAMFPNLRSFLQIIVSYIISGQKVDLRQVDEHGNPTRKSDPAKFAFTLMSRTSFSSMYSSLLSPEEQKLFKGLVENDMILEALSKQDPDLKLTRRSRFFKHQHGGRRRGPTIYRWLKSIIKPSRRRDKYGKIRNKKGRWVKTDLLSRPKGGSHAMGAFDVETEKGKKDTDLVKFEVRSTVAHGGRTQPANKWVEYAKSLFFSAIRNRSRPETKDDPATPENEAKKTRLKYNPQWLKQAEKTLSNAISKVRFWF